MDQNILTNKANAFIQLKLWKWKAKKKNHPAQKLQKQLVCRTILLAANGISHTRTELIALRIFDTSLLSHCSSSHQHNVWAWRCIILLWQQQYTGGFWKLSKTGNYRQTARVLGGTELIWQWKVKLLIEFKLQVKWEVILSKGL